jgi:hypothetical protein
MAHFLKPSARAQTTRLWSSCGQTRVSAKGSSQRSWEPTLFREPSSNNKMVSPLQVRPLPSQYQVVREESTLTTRAGQQDDSPRKWDTRYFSQTQAKTAPRGVYRFASDVNLANANTTSGQAFTEFANDAGAWATAFQSSMYKLSILGLSGDATKSLQDCTSIVG